MTGKKPCAIKHQAQHTSRALAAEVTQDAGTVAKEEVRGLKSHAGSHLGNRRSDLMDRSPFSLPWGEKDQAGHVMLVLGLWFPANVTARKARHVHLGLGILLLRVLPVLTSALAQ